MIIAQSTRPLLARASVDSMQTVDADIAGDFDQYYRDHTRVHSLVDDEFRWPDGSIMDEDEGTITLDDWRAGKLHP